MAKRPGGAGDPFWYKDAIIHELHVRELKDSNGDGIGDFPGLKVHSIYGTMNVYRFFLAAAHQGTVQFPLAGSSREADACRRECAS